MIKIKKRSFFGFLGFLTLCIAYLYINPIVILPQERKILKSKSLKKGDVFNLNKVINAIDKKEIIKYHAYIIIDFSELKYLSSNIHKNKILESTDSLLISQLLNCDLVYSNADQTTINSKIYIYRNGLLVFESAIALDDHPGFQNRELGWVVPKDTTHFLNICRGFHRYKLPVLVIL